MSDADAAAAILEAARFGALMGVGLGVVLALVIRELVIDFKAWRRSLEHHRFIRCDKDWKQPTEHL